MGEMIGQKLGEFEIVRELGRGGMGVVYEAIQTSLGRKVALKVLGPGMGLTARAMDRFRREAASAARLHHTNIVPVYATGEADGYNYYAMELVDGPSLDRVIADLRCREASRARTTATIAPALAATGPYVEAAPTLSPSGSASLGPGSSYFDTIARMVADVADALDHAHQHGVIHRDVKPSNLLLSSEGLLSLNDFGLARCLEEPGVTVQGELVGTPAYMSPEQIAAGRVPVDHRTDIYSLGATLYELLTLGPPFPGDQRDKIYAQVLHKEPVSPRKANPKTPVDLDTICLKCLEKDPDRRYQTAKELADDLRRYVNRFAVEARRSGPLTKFRKWVRRNPAVAALGLAMCLALCAAGGFAWLAMKATADAAKAQAEERKKQRAEALDLAMAFALAGNTAEAERKVAEAAELGATNEEVFIARGVIAMYSGRQTAAVGYFHQAIGAEPSSVAAYGLLSYVYGQAGDWESAERALDVAKRMVPRDDTWDRLFLGVAIGVYDPPGGIALMEQALQEGAAPRIAPALLAEARIPRAFDTARVADAQAALNNVAEAANGHQLANSPVLVYQRVYANLAAATAYQTHADPTGRAAALREAVQADGDFNRLGPSVIAYTTRWMYLSYVAGLKPDADPAADLARVRPKSDDPILTYIDALRRFRLGHDKEAFKLVEEHPDERNCLQLRAVIALTNPEYWKEAQDVWEDMTRPNAANERLGNSLRYAPFFHDRRELGILQRLNNARAHGLTPGEQGAMVRFVARQATEDEMLSAMTTNGTKTQAYYVAGLKRLADGQRPEAEKCFAAAHQFMTVGWSSWELATAFLIRMSADKDWPRLLQKK